MPRALLTLLVLLFALAVSACPVCPSGQVCHAPPPPLASCPAGQASTCSPVPTAVPTPPSGPCPVCKFNQVKRCFWGTLMTNPVTPAVNASDYPLRRLYARGFSSANVYLETIDLGGDLALDSEVKATFSNPNVKKVYLVWADAQADYGTSTIMSETAVDCP